MMHNHFADIILPLAVKGTFTYLIPEEMTGKVFPGSRVLVQFGKKKLYSGIIFRIHNDSPSAINIRTVISVLDPFPLVNEIQLKFWLWISEYYLCSIGEVMKAALPSDLCLEGVTEVPVIEKYKPREVTFVKLASEFSGNELNIILDSLTKAPQQYKALTAFLSFNGYEDGRNSKAMRKSLLIKETGSSQGIIDSLVRKKILSYLTLATGRLSDAEVAAEPKRN